MKLDAQKFNLSTLIAGGVVVTILVVVISGFILKGLFGKLSLNNQLLSKKRQAQNQLTENLAALETLKTEYAALGGQKDLIYDALPKTVNFSGIVSMMENLTTNAGAHLLSISPSAVTEAAGSTAAAATDGPQGYEYTATVSGSYDSIKSFLRNVEVSVRPLAITVMKINSESNEISLEMTIKTYYQAEFDTNLKTVPLTTSSGSTGPSLNVDPSKNTNLNPAAGAAQ